MLHQYSCVPLHLQCIVRGGSCSDTLKMPTSRAISRSDGNAEGATSNVNMENWSMNYWDLSWFKWVWSDVRNHHHPWLRISPETKWIFKICKIEVCSVNHVAILILWSALKRPHILLFVRASLFSRKGRHWHHHATDNLWWTWVKIE